MLWLDAAAFPTWGELLKACSPYASLTGARYLKEDFEAQGSSWTSRSGEEFEAAISASRGVVETYKLLVREAQDDSTLRSEYEAAYAQTLRQAAVSTMIAALKALDRYEPNGTAAEPLTPALISEASYASLSASLRAAVDESRESRRAAAFRAAMFVADFGSLHGLPKVATPEADALLVAFHAKVDGGASAKAALADAFEPYKELFLSTPWDLEGARSWAKAHPDEASILAVGAAALAVGVGLLGLLSSSRKSAPLRRGRR